MMSAQLQRMAAVAQELERQGVEIINFGAGVDFPYLQVAPNTVTADMSSRVEHIRYGGHYSRHAYHDNGCDVVWLIDIAAETV